MRKFLKALALTLLAAVVLLPFLPAEASADAPFRIILNGETLEAPLTLELGETYALSASRPVKSWTRSNKAFCDLGDGTLTPRRKGTYTLTAQAEDGSRTSVKITVVRHVTDITVTGKAEMTAGKTASFKAKVLPTDASTKSVVWSSSDPTVATVNKYGTVTAKAVTKKSTVVIKAAAKDGSGVVGEYAVTVYPKVSSISLYLNGEKVNGKTLAIDKSEISSLNLTAVAEPADANQAVTWKSSYTSRASVANGLVTLKNKGAVTITATASDGTRVSGSVKLNVTILSKSVSVSGNTSVRSGKTVALKAKVLPTDTVNKNVTWSSSDPTVATVSRSGVVTAKSVNSRKTVTITATAADGSGASCSYDVTVCPAVKSISLYLNGEKVNGKTLAIDKSEIATLQLTAVVEPAGAMQDVTWKSSYTSRASVASGLVTLKNKGTLTVTATATDGTRVSGSVKLNVTILSKSVSVSGNTSVRSGKTLSLKAKVLPTDTVNKNVTWSSSDPTAAAVSRSGVVTAKSVSSRKTVTITATAADGSGACCKYDVTVYPKVSTVSIYLNGERVNGKTLAVDPEVVGTLQLTTVSEPADAAQGVTWQSSNKNYASVSNGLVTVKKKGLVTIKTTAADGSGVTGSVKLNIGVISKSVTVSGPQTVNSGKKITLKATVLPTNAVNKAVTWSSSDTTAATVSSTGVVTAQTVSTARTVTITASAKDGGSSGTWQVTVQPLAQSVSILRDGEAVPSVVFMDSANKNAQIKLAAKIKPAAASQRVTWTSGNTRVVKVDSNGVLTCVGEGKTIVTAKAADGSGKSRTVYVAVGNLANLPYYVEVDKTNQVVRIYERGDGTYTHLVRRMIASTGKRDDALKDGFYRLNGSRSAWCRAKDPTYYMQYATRIEGSYMFHSVPTIGRYADRTKASYYNVLGQRASGGCVRLLCADAKWIYQNLPEKSFVLVAKFPADPAESAAVSAPPLKTNATLVWDPTDDNPNNPYYDPTYTSAVD